MRGRRFRPVLTSCVAAALVVSIVALDPTPVVAAGTVIDHRPPSDAPIVDHFRPPPRPWMAGNRGIDYGTEPGASIRASADGRVIFAGQVGDALHVTIEHADGLRTSYSFVESLAVSAGARVRTGDVIAIAGGPFHFGVRTPDDTYLDPEALLAGTLRPQVRLVPGTDQGLDALGAGERRSLLAVLVDDGIAAVAAVSEWQTRTSALVAHYVVELDPSTHAARVLDEFGRWLRSRDRCTSPTVTVPPHPRRIVVLVSGLGTSSDANTAWEIDTRTLGYADADVVRFSYAGGQAPALRPGTGPGIVPVVDRSFDAIDTHPFDALDSQQSVGTSADRLTVLLQSVAAAQPGVPIDVIAHSQGGVVARLAIERGGDSARLPEEVDTLVTVASPQRGAPLATGVVALADSPGGAAALSHIRAVGVADELDDRLPAIPDLAETSAVIEEIHRRPMPDGVRFVTIGGSGDLVVPGSSAIDDAADAAIIVPTEVGTGAHGSLPSSAAATREIGLAVAGMGPTCQGPGEALTAFVEAESIRFGESAGAAAAAVTAGVLAIPPPD